MHYILSKTCDNKTTRQAEISSIDSLGPTGQSIAFQYLACWQGRGGGSWQAWTWVDRSAAPPWKTPLNALKEEEKERAQAAHHWAGSVYENPKVHTGHMHKKKPSLLMSESTFINVSVWRTPPFQLDLCQGYWGWCFDTVALIFQLNSRAHHECQILQLYLPEPCTQQPSGCESISPTTMSGITASLQKCEWLSKNYFYRLIINHATGTPLETKGCFSLVLIRTIEVHLSCTWQLWVYFLSHVLGQVARHLPPDVHEYSGVWGGDLVDEHGARVGQHQLSMVGFKLGTVLERSTQMTHWWR